jgi:cobyrinic acid a,c-diamide synthase
VIAGVASGVGKTTTTVGLCRALRARGLQVAVFKCGPDYLDPTYHARAAGRLSHNLDGWLMGQTVVRETFARAAAGADIALIEGVMGLFDGAAASGPDAEAGSTAEIAKWLQAPVVLVADAGGMARSFAALVAGFAGFDRDLPLCGVLANQVGSRGHLELLRKALGPALPPLLGGLPKGAAPAFPHRHLGLHAADAETVPDALFDEWGEAVAAWCNLDALLAVARQAAAPAQESSPTSTAARTPTHTHAPRCRIGLARDQAFHFYYEDNLRRLEALGAALVPFSPLHDARLPEGLDGLYLGGGYPELFAAGLAGNVKMRAAIADFAHTGRPVHGECGGLMYLCQAIRTRDGARHPMLGLLPGEAVMGDRLAALGYAEVELTAPCILGAPGLRFRGHQFRYSQLVEPGTSTAYRVRQRRGGEAFAEGFCAGNVLGSYVHAHWASNPLVAAAFVESCVERGARR